MLGKFSANYIFLFWSHSYVKNNLSGIVKLKISFCCRVIYVHSCLVPSNLTLSKLVETIKTKRTFIFHLISGKHLGNPLTSK